MAGSMNAVLTDDETAKKRDAGIARPEAVFRLV